MALTDAIFGGTPKRVLLQPAADFADTARGGGAFAVTRIDFEVLLDASLNETHTGTADITDHPVETGAHMNDHIRARPRELEIHGVVTETPLEFLAGLRTSGSRIRDAFDVLEDMRAEGIPLDVETALKPYKNMGIRSLSVNRDVTTKRVLDVTLDLKEIRVAETRSTQIRSEPKPADADNRTAGRAENKGTVAKKAPSAAQSAKAADVTTNKSPLLGITETLGLQ